MPLTALLVSLINHILYSAYLSPPLALLEQEITGDVLLDLNMDTLKELGISAYGRRYKIMAAISKLRAATTTAQDQSKTEDDVNQVSTALLMLPICRY